MPKNSKPNTEPSGAPRWTYIVGAIVPAGALILGFISYYNPNPRVVVAPPPAVPESPKPSTQGAASNNGQNVIGNGNVTTNIQNVYQPQVPRTPELKTKKSESPESKYKPTRTKPSLSATDDSKIVNVEANRQEETQAAKNHEGALPEKQKTALPEPSSQGREFRPPEIEPIQSKYVDVERRGTPWEPPLGKFCFARARNALNYLGADVPALKTDDLLGIFTKNGASYSCHVHCEDQQVRVMCGSPSEAASGAMADEILKLMGPKG